MRIAGFGCAGCGGLLALAGLAVLVLAFVPGVINSAETGTAIGAGGSLCASSFLPLLIGVVLIVVGGGKKNEFDV